MKIKLNYHGTKSFGNGNDTPNYSIAISRENNKIRIYIKFIEKPQGLSNNYFASSEIEGFEIYMDFEEACNLSAILESYLHHPIHGNEDLKWMQPDKMPLLDDSIWKDSVRLKCVDPNLLILKLENKSNLQLGKIEYQINYKLNGESKLYKTNISTNKIAYPNSEYKITLDEDILKNDDVNFIWNSKITSCKLISVMGIDPENL